MNNWRRFLEPAHVWVIRYSSEAALHYWGLTNIKHEEVTALVAQLKVGRAKIYSTCRAVTYLLRPTGCLLVVSLSVVATSHARLLFGLVRGCRGGVKQVPDTCGQHVPAQVARRQHTGLQATCVSSVCLDVCQFRFWRHSSPDVCKGSWEPR